MKVRYDFLLLHISNIQNFKDSKTNLVYIEKVNTKIIVSIISFVNFMF